MEKSIFNKWYWHNWILTCRRMKIDPYLSPCTKVMSKWIKDINIKSTKVNLIEEKVGSVGSILEHIGTGDYFLNIISVAQTLRGTINKGDFLKLRRFCKAKNMINKIK